MESLEIAGENEGILLLEKEVQDKRRIEEVLWDKGWCQTEMYYVPLIA